MEGVYNIVSQRQFALLAWRRARVSSRRASGHGTAHGTAAARTDGQGAARVVWGGCGVGAATSSSLVAIVPANGFDVGRAKQNQVELCSCLYYGRGCHQPIIIPATRYMSILTFRIAIVSYVNVV